jgi:hypothetical protein
MQELSRRRLLLAGAGVLSMPARAAPNPAAWTARVVQAPEAMRQLHAGGPTGLLGTGASGSLWALSLADQAPQQMAEGLDSQTPIASGHGRIAARTQRGALWVWQGGHAVTSVLPNSARVAAHAGLLILPLAVLAVVAEATDAAQGGSRVGHRLVRFEPDGAGQWREVARSKEAVLPDARPLQVDLDNRGDGGHIVVLAGPDGARYDHGVLGDAIEATAVRWLERHSLDVLRELSLPAPHVFEDISPRPVTLPGPPASIGLLTVRSGPDGGQLALVVADAARPRGLRLLALGDTVGGFHRWLAPTTDGQHLMAVHTPHIGGVLHVYQLEGQQLTRRRVANDVSTHRIGSRELDLSAWSQGLLILPTQDGKQLRVLNPQANGADVAVVPLPGRVTLTTALVDAPAIVALLDDGRVVWVSQSVAGSSSKRSTG